MPTREGAPDTRPPAGRATKLAVLGTALVLCLLVVILQLTTPPSSHIASVLVAIPAIMAFAFRPPMIIGSAIVAAATRWLLLPTEPQRIGSVAGTTVVISVIAALSCFVVRRGEQDYARLRKVVSVAETAQRAVLRPPPETLGRFRTAASYLAAAQYARIGGDLYAVADTDFGVRALIGDVRGKGLGAVSTAAAVLGSFHEAAYEQPTLGRLAGRLDTGLSRFLRDEEAFVTALLIETAPDGRTHAYSCGHPPALVLGTGTVRELPAAPGLPLGLRALAAPPTPPDTPQPAGTHLHPGDTLLLYTDGIAETRDAAGTFYPLTTRLTAYQHDHPAPVDPHHLLAWLLEDAQAYSADDTYDDAALLALTWLPGGDADEPAGIAQNRLIS
ncbi:MULTISPECIES: PP2C family protein-serine/threonine phosphatase [unclassified Streptomyces]|uniref:PP2C family protein-serine/threonine phosphatase n=1 Tax=unclassified Streptomyces TaxID=2593676 RepID=UPI002ED5D9A1|nr:serine/threonine-protein phosphatase [Streptomyces sp. NBC_00891]WSY05962.1 serine/threonine-protein phosphatase [Streptomyces sp. NBC_00890]WSZ07586.1 serine/threonine-protein phosphatase [Streptomyces sp. NBC_00869]WSZ24915.1 serine/threonine-protein phosphatase [Streptomyces sp. NBC_00870]